MSASSNTNGMLGDRSDPAKIREVALYALLTILLLFGASIAAMVYKFAMPRAETVEVGHIDHFEIDKPVLFTESKVKLWIVNTGQELYVLDPHTTHPTVRCQVVWEESLQMFSDPCLGTRFSITGAYQFGPAPRGLDRYTSQVVNGKIRVNLSTRIPGQPSCAFASAADYSHPWENYRFIPAESQNHCD
ncbi:MAG: hypothetical protein KF893_07725 [Caldilineaceae bacterium]|nr:hypothetical protein [Caldilineaceae bacterium]